MFAVTLEPAIGSTLREARLRRGVGLAEVEAETKIRVRYLRALENEEWDVLPGGAYTRSFIRTYGGFLGLDGERLADEYRRSAPETGGERQSWGEPLPLPPSQGDGGPRVSPGTVAALVSVGLIAALIVIGLLGDGGSDGTPTRPAGGRDSQPQEGGKPPAESRRKVSVTVLAEANVWVCLIDGAGRRLIDGRILAAGSREGPFESARFTVAFGNGSVRMTVDGDTARLEQTPNPIGYEVARDGRLRTLPEGRRPTCT